MEHRTCGDSKGRGCGRTLPVDSFAKKGKHPGGTQRYHALCKPCFADVYREWCEENPTTRAATRHRSYVKRANTERAKAKEGWKRDADRRRAKHREWWAANRDAVNARRRAARYATKPDARDVALR